VLASFEVKTGSADLHEVFTGQLVEWITKVVEIESPVHFDEACHRIDLPPWNVPNSRVRIWDTQGG
jgi:hypothetical protein